MAPKNAKGKPKGKATNRDEEETEEKLQAVVLADDFENRFRPFTLQEPRCLLPLANTCLLDYTLEWLAMSGVTEVFIYPGTETVSKVMAYIMSSKWHPKSQISPFDVIEVVISKATSIGEAMRDLDRRKVVSGDFLVVHGDLVSNVPIADALMKHKARRAKDKNAIMTMLLAMGDDGERSTLADTITPVFVLNRHGRCVHYEEMNPLLQEDRHVRLVADILSEHDDVEIRTDLIDTGIDICTPDVLALWSDEFDYQEPRKQFLHGVLKDYELNGKTIYTELLDEHYAARVNSLQAYDAVCKDLLCRWTFPFVPDSNLPDDQTYTYSRGGVIKEDGVVLSRACRLGENTVVGKDTSIGDGANISNSTIGRRCQIGKNVTIKDAYIWDDVMVGDGAHITQSIIASEATIGTHATISRGTVISFGVQIAANKFVVEGLRIAGEKPDHTNSKPTESEIVGEGGSGYLFTDEDEPENEREEEFLKIRKNLFYSMANLSLSTDSVSTFTSDASGLVSSTDQVRRLSSGSMSDDDPSGFHHDAVQGLYDTLQENGDFDSAKLEFMGLRLSNNATDNEIRHAIAVAFVKNMLHFANEENLDAIKAVKKSLDTRGATTFLKEVAIGKSKEVLGQSDFLLELQKQLSARDHGPEILFALCHQLYEREVVEEEGFEEWWKDEKTGNTDDMKAVKQKTEAFIQWLREAEEEDSEEDSDDDDESDDE